MMHGMNGSPVDLQKNIIWLRQAFPGIYVKNLNVYPGPPSGSTKMAPMMDAMNLAIISDPVLREGFNLYGESQGALMARVWVQMWNNPPVYNLVANCGPQSGVGMCPTIDWPIIADICAGGAPIIDIYDWPGVSFADYWKGFDKEQYLRKSHWLAATNNEKDEKNTIFADRMKSLNFYQASAASGDQIVQPRESAWHTFWPFGGSIHSAVEDWRHTESYLGDWLGIKTLDEQGKVDFNMFEGTHTVYPESWWKNASMPLFGNKLSGSPLPPSPPVSGGCPRLPPPPPQVVV